MLLLRSGGLLVRIRHARLWSHLRRMAWLTSLQLLTRLSGGVLLSTGMHGHLLLLQLFLMALLRLLLLADDVHLLLCQMRRKLDASRVHLHARMLRELLLHVLMRHPLHAALLH